MLSLLFFVFGVVMVCYAVMSFKSGGPKQLMPWMFLAIGLGNIGVLPGVLLPIGIVLWLIGVLKNHSSRQVR